MSSFSIFNSGVGGGVPSRPAIPLQDIRQRQVAAIEPQQEEVVARPAMPALYTDENGNPSYDNNQSWFETFTDRRLYAQTGGGAGYWGFGWRTPTRTMYDSYIGLDPNMEPDPEWLKQKADETWVTNRVKMIEQNIGTDADVLKNYYGQDIIKSLVQRGNSLDDETARLTFALDESKSFYRIMDYDAASGWGTYLGTKVASGVGNYMAVDPVTSVSTMLSLGAGTVLPALARSAVIAEYLPWLSTPSLVTRSWLISHGPLLAKSNIILGPIDGAISGYAYHYGYNKDREMLHGEDSIYEDDSVVDDVSIGAAFGLAGGLFAYGMGIRNARREAAIEALAMSGLSVPTRDSLDYTVRYSVAHSNLLRRLKASGIAETDDVFKQVADPSRLNEAGFRSVEDVLRLTRQVDDLKPDAAEFGSMVARKTNLENTKAVTFRTKIKSVLDAVPDGDGFIDDGTGKMIPNYAKYGNEIAGALDADTRAVLKAANLNDNEIDSIFDFFGTRVGVDKLDLHKWVQISDVNERDGRILLQFMGEEIANERRALAGLSKIAQARGLDINTMSFRQIQDFTLELDREANAILDAATTTMDRVGLADRLMGHFHDLANMRTKLFRNGLKPEEGHPQVGIRKLYGMNDTKTVNKALRTIGKLERRGEINSLAAEELRKWVEIQKSLNDLARTRMKQGELGEVLGLLNTHILTDMQSPHLIDGLYPLRTAFRGELDELNVSDAAVRGQRFATLWDSLPETAAPVGDLTSAYKTAKTNRMAAARSLQAGKQTVNEIGKGSTISRAEETAAGIAFQFTRANGTLSRVLTIAKEGLEDVFDATSLTAFRNAIAAGKTPEDAAKLLKFNDTASISKGLTTRLGTAEAALTRAGKERNLGYAIRNEDYSFWVGNKLLGAMRATPFLGWGMHKLARLALDSTIMGVNLGGLRAGRLWFNPESMSGHGAIRQLTMLANLIDSPHVLKGDIGRLVDNGLFSIQAIRNWNASQAAKVIKVIRDAATRGEAFSPEDYRAIRDVVAGRLERGKLTPKQEQLYAVNREVISGYIDDLLDIIDSVDASKFGIDEERKKLLRAIFETETREQIADAMQLAMLVPNQSVIIAKRGEFRDTIRNVLTRLVDDNMKLMRGRDATLIDSDSISTWLETRLTGLIEARRAKGATPAQLLQMEQKMKSVLALPADKQIDAAITLAKTKDELDAIFDSTLKTFDADETTGFGVRMLWNNLTDTEVANAKTFDDILDIMEGKRTNQDFIDLIRTRVNDYDGELAPSAQFIRKPGQQVGFPASASGVAGIRQFADGVYMHLLRDAEMDGFFHHEMGEAAVAFATGNGTRIRTSAQLVRTMGADENGNQGIFALINQTRKEMNAALDEMEERGSTKVAGLRERLNEDFNNLEDMTAYGLGYGTSTETRYGILETAFRINNGYIRAKRGGNWGFQTAIAEVFKTFLLGANREGFLTSFGNMLRSVFTKDDLWDIGGAIEQFTRKYSPGVDTEAYVGGMSFGRIPTGVGNIPVANPPVRFQGHSPASGFKDWVRQRIPVVGRLRDTFSGAAIDPQGTARLAAGQQPTTVGQRATQTGARVADTATTAVEAAANTTTRLGGQQYFQAMGRDMAVRQGKRYLQNNIGALLNLSRRYREAMLAFKPGANASDVEKFKILSKLSEETGVDPYLAARLLHHGLLDEGNLGMLNRAIARTTEAESKAGRVIGFLSGATKPFKVETLRRYLDDLAEEEVRVMAASRAAQDLSPERANLRNVDELMMRLTSWLDEEANTAMNSATLISSAPNANLGQRWISQFSNYVRAFTHQTMMRGANDTSINRMMMMVAPVIIGEMLYFESIRLLESKYQKGEVQYQKELDDRIRAWREAPEEQFARIIARIPIGGVSQSFLLNAIINPMEGTVLGADLSQSNVPILTQKPDALSLKRGTHKAFVKSEDIINEYLTFGNPREQNLIDKLDERLVSERTLYSKPYQFPLVQFTPYTDLANLAKDMLSGNPYIDKKSKYLYSPDSPLYNLVPGFRAWWVQGMVNHAFGDLNYQEDNRAYRWNKLREESVKRFQFRQ